MHRPPGSPQRWILPLLCLLAVTAGGALLILRPNRATFPSTSPPTVTDHLTQLPPELAAQLARIEATEQQMNDTVWAREQLAQECGRTVEAWWDAFNAATNKLAAAATWQFQQLIPPAWNPPTALPHQLSRQTPARPGTPMGPDDWRQLLDSLERNGWRPVQTEFRQVQFDTDDAGRPRRSVFTFSLHLTQAIAPNRATLEGPLVIEWSPERSANGEFAAQKIDASSLSLVIRPGPPPFELWLEDTVTPLRNSNSIDPLILQDLDGDGRPEIILAAVNRVYRMGPDGRFGAAELCRHTPGLISTALVADFDGDGAADFLTLRLEGLALFPGSARGTFDEPARLVWKAPPELTHAMALTCGDLDHDGDLDLFLAQYKPPYDAGSMPTPVHDARDGLPAYLLRNDGTGHFTDITPGSGLEAKRHRRTYSASFVDLNHDRHLDLVVVSDFAGVDLYRNDGRGRFEDVTERWVPEPRGLGMGHALSDLNADGRLDLLMIGMNSPTVDRLEHLGLWRPHPVQRREMRARLTYGNRLYLGRANEGFETTPLNDSLARSGWSWGCAASDFDNDGWPDVYIANGMESRESVRDYESEFWLRDTFVGTSADDPAVYLYFRAKLGRTQGRGYSYGGYEKNRLYLNQGGRSFLEAGHLFGVSLEEDSRNVVGADLDSDGRVDLLVTSYEIWPKPRQTLRIYRNTLNPQGDWIGFDLRGGGRDAIGAHVTLEWKEATATRVIVAGDSHRSQQDPRVHFGLGSAGTPERAEVRWASGERTLLYRPAPGRYHPVSPPQPTQR